MAWRSRRAAFYVALVLVTTLAFATVYNVGMAVWEGSPQSFFRSLEVVVQSFTTTGYGEDAPWQSPQMNLLVILLQLAGIGLILTAVDVFAVPWLRDVLSPAPPTSASDASDHVIVCEHTPRTDAFLEELDARDRSFVLIEADSDRATELHESGYRVIHADPESPDAFEAAGLEDAVAVVADASDDRNASITLAARAIDPEARVVTLVEDASLARYHRAAGADRVLSPRQLLGRSLAEQVPTTVSADIADVVSIGEDLELVEVSITAGSNLAGRSLADLDDYGVTIVGAWIDGEFHTPVAPDRPLDPGTTLFLAGPPDRVDGFREATAVPVHPIGDRRVVLAGYGDSGRSAAEVLSATDTPVTVLDRAADGDVDVVGDACNPETLSAAGVEDAHGLLVALGDDTAAVLTTLIARQLNPELRIAVRADQEADVDKLYRAGADYAQSLATVSGRMLASTVFEDEEVIAAERRLRIAKLAPGDLVGDTLAGADVRAETGATVVAAIRDGEVLADLDPQDFTVEAGDELVVAGTDAAVTRFEQVFGA